MWAFLETKEIVKQLNIVRELMKEEKYDDAITLINKLKELDKNNDFDQEIVPLSFLQ